MAPADNATLRRWYDEGRSLREVAALGGVSHETARTRILAAGGTLRSTAAAGGGGGRPRWSKRPPPARLREMYQTMSSLDIAADLGVGDSTVRGWLRQAGIVTRGPGRRPSTAEEVPSVCGGAACAAAGLVTQPEVVERLDELGYNANLDVLERQVYLTRQGRGVRVAYPEPCPADPRRRRHWADVLAWGIRTGRLSAWAEQASARLWGTGRP